MPQRSAVITIGEISPTASRPATALPPQHAIVKARMA